MSNGRRLSIARPRRVSLRFARCPTKQPGLVFGLPFNCLIILFCMLTVSENIADQNGCRTEFAFERRPLGSPSRAVYAVVGPRNAAEKREMYVDEFSKKKLEALVSSTLLYLAVPINIQCVSVTDELFALANEVGEVLKGQLGEAKYAEQLSKHTRAITDKAQQRKTEKKEVGYRRCSFFLKLF